MKPITFLVAGVLMAQAPHADVAKLLGSGRNDLWVLGAKPEPKDRSAEVQVWSRELPIVSWGTVGTGQEPSALLYAEHPEGWDWKQRAAVQLYNGEFYHLSKYDERSAFSLMLGPSPSDGVRLHHTGTIFRFEEGHLKLIPDALKQARTDYGLSETQNFLGMVENRIFYFDPAQSDRVFFFEKGNPGQRFEVAVPIHPLWPRSWKLESADQVFTGDKPGEILVYVWAKNTAWMSASSRRDSSGVAVDLKTAKPVSSRAK